MKNFYKWSAITAGIMLAIGLILAFTCTIIGGRKAINAIENWQGFREAVAVVDDVVYDVSNGNWHILVNEDNPTELTLNGNTITAGNSQVQIEAAGITGLNLNLGAGSFTIEEKETDDGQIELTVSGIGVCDYFTKGKTLYVSGFKGISGIANTAIANKITLEVPKGMAFENVELEAGAGLMEISGLEAVEMNAVIGAGELVLQGITAQEFESEIGAGRLQAEEMDVLNADISLSMGECVYNGFIRGDLNAECDMGNMELKLSGKQEEHNFDIECAAGNIDMAGYQMTALTAEREIDNGAESDYEISCNMGNISIDFEEE